MFGRIANSYDRLNRIMTFRQDPKWRKEAARKLGSNPKTFLLDLGSGTGDMLMELWKNSPESTIVGLDFTPEMIQIGKKRKGLKKIHWVIADALHLPFPASSFHGTISAFLMRNLSKVDPVVFEQHRVLCHDGRLVCLEATPPQRNPFYIFVKFYLTYIIPLLGRLISRDLEAYTYLSSSIAEFIDPHCFAQKIESAGFHDVQFARHMLGTIAIHEGTKA
jgi:demethylmenaquinone methyltransferase/2-methoxy-6-polyprenyl-1,4-benzoquinol methylase